MLSKVMTSVAAAVARVLQGSIDGHNNWGFVVAVPPDWRVDQAIIGEPQPRGQRCQNRRRAQLRGVCVAPDARRCHPSALISISGAILPIDAALARLIESIGGVRSYCTVRKPPKCESIYVQAGDGESISAANRFTSRHRGARESTAVCSACLKACAKQPRSEPQQG